MRVQRGNFKLSKAGIQSQCRPEDENHNNFSGALRNCLSKFCCCKIHNLKALLTYSSLNWVNKDNFFLYLTVSLFFFSGSYQGSIQNLILQNQSVYHEAIPCLLILCLLFSVLIRHTKSLPHFSGSSTTITKYLFNANHVYICSMDLAFKGLLNE